MSSPIYMEMEHLPHCCGVIEIGDFHNSDDSLSNEELKAAWKERIDTCLSDMGELAYFHFVRYQGKSKFQNFLLMEVIDEHPRALDLCTFVNPNTGNTIRAMAITPIGADVP